MHVLFSCCVNVLYILRFRCLFRRDTQQQDYTANFVGIFSLCLNNHGYHANHIQEKLLLELVPQHTMTSTRKCGKAEVQWGPVSHALNRTKPDCISKFHLLRYATLRKGPFSEEEDALILQRKAEWEEAGDGLYGLWKALEEMGRPATNIRNRWAITLAHM